MTVIIEPGLNAADFCKKVVKPKIDELGPAVAFSADKLFLLLYAGPLKSIQRNYGILQHWKRAPEEALRLGAAIIDTTPIGLFLVQFDWKTYFDSAYGGDKKVIQHAVEEVWEFHCATMSMSGTENKLPFS